MYIIGNNGKSKNIFEVVRVIIKKMKSISYIVLILLLLASIKGYERISSYG